MSKTNVIAIVGDSGSGKTYASMYLQMKFKWKAIVSYTTRPMREGEIQGREHWFVQPSSVPPKDKMCAYTKFGGYEYWTEWSQFTENPYCIYVIDEKGLIDLMSKEQSPISFHLITIKIKRPNKTGIEAERIARDNERINLADDFYDYIINNDSSIEAYHAQLDSTGSIINSKQL